VLGPHTDGGQPMVRMFPVRLVAVPHFIPHLIRDEAGLYKDFVGRMDRDVSADSSNEYACYWTISDLVSRLWLTASRRTPSPPTFALDSGEGCPP
jgi:hypothetical protein